MSSYKKSASIGGGITFFVLVVSILTFYYSLGPCPSGTFPCDNYKKCLPQRQICDDRIDCLDGTDENSVQCGMFHGSKNLVLDIMLDAFKAGLNESYEDNDVSNVKNCTIKTYPKFCQCLSKKIKCGFNNLQTVPEISGEVSHLLIIGNNLTLYQNSLQGLNISYLNLKHNNISKIPMGFFFNQKLLSKIDLRYNQIESLEYGIFKGLRNVKWLLVSSNVLHDVPLVIFQDLSSIIWLNISDNQLTLKNDYFRSMDTILELYIDMNRIEGIQENTFAQLIKLELLSLNNNNIRFIHSKAFWELKSLTDLRLANNPLTAISDNTFARLSNLDALFLGNTEINITKNILAALNLTYLNLDGISEHLIDFQALQIPNLQYILLKKFSMCAMVPHIKKCKPNTDGISSIEDLLSKPILRYSIWCMALITIAGNILVLYGRHIFRDENRTVTVVIRNLAIADILMGFYLIVIGIQDIRYRNNYHENANKWISSWTCALTGVLAVTSSEVSMFILGFMSLERFLLIANPFSGKNGRLTSKNIRIYLGTIWLLGSFIAIIPVIMWHSSTRFYGTYSGTCFPLHIEDKFALGWKYSAFIFLGVNLFLLIMIIILYSALLLSIFRTRRATTTPLTILDCEFAIRFFFIVLTDVACWSPIICTKIWTFLNYEISEDTYAWLIVFVLPLNSAVNPMLYTFTTPKYRAQVWLRGWHKITAKRKTIDGSTRESNPTASNQGINHSSSIKVFTT